MRRFFLLVSMTLLSTGCLWIPSAGTNSEIPTEKSNLLWFNPEGCYLPCVWNIVPGETSMDEAIHIIETTVPPEQIVYSGLFWITDADGSQIFIEVKQSDPRMGIYVKQIEVNGYIDGEIATLGEFLDAGYVPSRVFRNKVNGPGGVSLFILFDDAQTAVAIFDDFISADTPIMDLVVIAENEDEYLLGYRPFQEFFKYEISWIGYASAQEYLDLAPIN